MQLLELVQSVRSPILGSKRLTLRMVTFNIALLESLIYSARKLAKMDPMFWQILSVIRFGSKCDSGQVNTLICSMGDKGKTFVIHMIDR